MQPSKLSKYSASGGFTLIEIVISIVLLSLVFLMYQTMLDTVRFTDRARFDDIGLSIAVEQMEIYRAMDFNLLPDAPVSVSDPDLVKLPDGSGTVTVTDYGSADSGIKQVLVEIEWDDKGASRVVSLDSLVTNGGVGK